MLEFHPDACGVPRSRAGLHQILRVFMQSKIPQLNEAMILDKIGRMQHLPLLCGSLDRLWELVSNNESADVEEIAGLVRYDQILVAKVLQAANRSIFGKRKEIHTLRKAIELLEVENIRSICLSSLLNSGFSDTAKMDATHRESLWKHSYITARIAGIIVKKRAWMSEEQAYLLGLVHDIGVTAATILFPEPVARLKEPPETKKTPRREEEQRFGFLHTRIGKLLAIKWGLPEVFVNVIAFHHQPEQSTKFKPEVKLIGLANILACAEDHSELICDETTCSYLKDLYITEQEWEECIGSLDTVKDQAQQIWNLIG